MSQGKKKITLKDIAAYTGLSVNTVSRVLNKKPYYTKEVEEKDAIRNFQPPVSGEEIMATFHLSPCREIGTIKNAIKEAILDGLIGNNAAEAREYMFKVAKEIGVVS